MPVVMSFPAGPKPPPRRLSPRELQRAKDKFREEKGLPPSRQAQMAIRADAVRAAREGLVLTAEQRRISEEIEGMYRAASLVSGTPQVVERHLTRSGEGLTLVAPATSDAEDDEPEAGGLGRLSGYASVYSTPYRIDSLLEGRFDEVVLPSAFAEALRGAGPAIVSQFNHGKTTGLQLQLGPVQIRSNARGLRYSVRLLDTSTVREIRPLAEAGLLSSSVRFQVLEDQWTKAPPGGVATRKISALRLFELGPVDHPAAPVGPVTLGRAVPERRRFTPAERAAIAEEIRRDREARRKARGLPSADEIKHDIRKRKAREMGLGRVGG